MGKCVTEFNVSEAQVRTIVNKEIRRVVVVVRIVEFGNCSRSAFACPAVLDACGKVDKREVVSAGSVVNFYTCNALELSYKVETFPISSERETECPVGHTFTNFGVVSVVDNIIAVLVYEDKVAGFGRSVAVFQTRCLNFSLVLEYTCCLIAIEIVRWNLILKPSKKWW